MVFAVVTQSRGDASRLEEWVTYHSRLGFTEFHVILDGLVDDSDQVLAGIDTGATLVVHPRAESGEYLDGLECRERQQRNHRWRVENSDLLESLPFRAQDPLSVRQGINVTQVLDQICTGRKGWVAFIDVDEFIHLPRDGSVQALVRRLNSEKRTSRISFLNFNVDTTDHDPALPVLEQHSRRWSREDLVEYPVRAWAGRFKTMARFGVATPYGGVHKITRGPRTVVPPEDARLMHYRLPLQWMEPPIAYTVEDPVRMPAPRTESPLPARRFWRLRH